MSNSYKEDIRLMLSKLTQMIDPEDKTYSTLVSSIYNDFDNLNTIDECVIREYLTDCIAEITASHQVVEGPAEEVTELLADTSVTATCRIVPGDDGKFYVFDDEKVIGGYENEADAKAACDNATKNILVSAPEVEDVNEITEELPVDDASADLGIAEPTEDELEVEEEATDAELSELEQIIEDADNILSVIDSNINITTDLDTVAKLIVTEDAIAIKKQNLEDMDPADDGILDAVKSFRDFLEQVEVESIDLINKNAPGADVNEDVASDEKEALEELEENAEESLAADTVVEDEELVSEETAPITEDVNVVEDVVEDDEELKAIVDDKDEVLEDEEFEIVDEDDEYEMDADVKSLFREGSDDAPTEEELTEALGELDFDFDNNEFFDDEVIDDVSVVDEVVVEELEENVKSLDDLLGDLADLVKNDAGLEDDVALKVADLEDLLKEAVEEIKDNVDELKLDDVEEEIVDDEVVEDEVIDEEIIEDAEAEDKEFDEEATDEEVDEEIEEIDLDDVDTDDEDEDDKKAVKESVVIENEVVEEPAVDDEEVEETPEVTAVVENEIVEEPVEENEVVVGDELSEDIKNAKQFLTNISLEMNESNKEEKLTEMTEMLLDLTSKHSAEDLSDLVSWIEAGELVKSVLSKDIISKFKGCISSQKIDELSEADLHKVDFPGGTGADEGAIIADAKPVNLEKLAKDIDKTKANIENLCNSDDKSDEVIKKINLEVDKLNYKYDKFEDEEVIAKLQEFSDWYNDTKVEYSHIEASVVIADKKKPVYAIDKEIDKLKKKIVKQKMKENLGQKEVDKIREKFPLRDSTVDYEENKARGKSIEEFADWCASLTDKDMK